MRVHLQTLGCRLNEAELESWSRQLQALGHRLVTSPGQADLLVVNTCAVTEEAVRKSRKLLRRSQRENPGAKLVVSGCYASLEPQSVVDLGVDLLVPNRDKERLVEIAIHELDQATLPLNIHTLDAGEIPARRRRRAFLKVQDGCRYQCAFCVVTQARGEERSPPPSEVVAEVNRLHGTGVQEVVLSGVHIGGYGSDCGSDLVGLLEALLADTTMPRIRIGSLEPWDLPHRLWDLFADPRLQPHLHLPVQSGSDRVLRRMARRGKRAEYASLVAEARRRVTNLNLTTDIIVGFPGEEEADWHATLDLVAGLGFGQVHIFPFSARRGTRAAALPDQVNPTVRRQRCSELQALATRLRCDALARQVGRRCPVLVESRCRGEDSVGHWFGYTPNFLPVHICAPMDAVLQNCILEVTLSGVTADGESLLAEAGHVLQIDPALLPTRFATEE